MTERERQERQIEVDRARTQDYIASRIEASRGQDRGEDRQQKMTLERDRD